MVLPSATVWPLKLQAAGATVQLDCVYDPLSVPLEQFLTSEVQVLPNETLADWYAVTLRPLAMFCPFRVQAAAAATEQLELL